MIMFLLASPKKNRMNLTFNSGVSFVVVFYSSFSWFSQPYIPGPADIATNSFVCCSLILFLKCPFCCVWVCERMSLSLYPLNNSRVIQQTYFQIAHGLSFSYKRHIVYIILNVLLLLHFYLRGCKSYSCFFDIMILAKATVYSDHWIRCCNISV